MTNPKQNKDLLGKGIRSLLQSIDSDLKTGSGALKQNVVENATGISSLPVDEIETNPKQPRRDFDEKALQELADSIKLHDIIQPVTVSRMANGKYRLISGERRLSLLWLVTPILKVVSVLKYPICLQTVQILITLVTC